MGALLVLPVIFLAALSIAALGLGIGSMFESFEGFQVVSSFVSFPLFFLSGALYPLVGLPPYLQVLTTLNPLTYAVDLLRTRCCWGWGTSRRSPARPCSWPSPARCWPSGRSCSSG